MMGLMMRTSDDGLNIIKSNEGLKLEAYLDPAGIPTIGYGHTYGVHMGMTISQNQAEMFLRSDLIRVESFIMSLNLILDQAEFDALSSFIFNVGTGAFFQSKLLQYLKMGNYILAAQEFVKWCHARINGEFVELPGLKKRRIEEQNLFLKGIGVAKQVV